MRKNIYFLIIAFALQVPLSSYAQGFFENIFNKKLDVFRCTNAHDATSCNANCTREQDLNYDFIVDTNKSIVLLNGYKKDERVVSMKLEGCSVIDKSTWVCTSDNGQMRQGLMKGVFHYIHVFNINGRNFSNYACAK